jgi:hypothetical protein
MPIRRSPRRRQVQGLPLSGFNPRAPYTVAGQPVLPLPQRPIAGFSIVSEEYFTLMRIGLVEGATFTADDREGAPMAGIINQSFAKKIFPGQSALGKRFAARQGREYRGDDRRRDPRCQNEWTERAGAGRALSGTATVRTARAGDRGAHHRRADGLQAAIRSAVTEVDKDQPISFFATLETNIANSLACSASLRR